MASIAVDQQRQEEEQEQRWQQEQQEQHQLQQQQHEKQQQEHEMQQHQQRRQRQQQQQRRRRRRQQQSDYPSDLSDQLGQSWVAGELAGDRRGETERLPLGLQGPVLTAAEQALVEADRRMSSCYGVS